MKHPLQFTLGEINTLLLTCEVTDRTHFLLEDVRGLMRWLEDEEKRRETFVITKVAEQVQSARTRSAPTPKVRDLDAELLDRCAIIMPMDGDRAL